MEEGGEEEGEEQPHPERLTEKQLNELPVAVEVFGMDAVSRAVCVCVCVCL